MIYGVIITFFVVIVFCVFYFLVDECKKIKNKEQNIEEKNDSKNKKIKEDKNKNNSESKEFSKSDLSDELNINDQLDEENNSNYEKIFPHLTTDDEDDDFDKEIDDYIFMDMLDED